MRKRIIPAALAALLASSIGLSSCIGSFTLTSKVLNWNSQVGNKFVNEVVFFAFWILPVYEITALADMLVLNSIEFWSGNNPMSASVKKIDTPQGTYLVECDGSGYNITHQTTGLTTRLDFDVPTQTWSVVTDGAVYPFMTFTDTDSVRMITPDGSMTDVELSRAGVQAYATTVAAQAPAMAVR